MRKRKKQQLLNIIDSLCELHGEFMWKKASALAESFGDCQQAAIAIGEAIEQDAPKETEAVSLLEKYCEALFLLSQTDIVTEDAIEPLDELMVQVKEKVVGIQVSYQVAFFPYKAEMWDSMESIWRACRADERCEAVVVPIPYFKYDAASKQTVPCYEGDKLPEDVPIVSFMEYSVEAQLPEVAYIHNPYDNCNLVTSVHPSFYSSELKKYVQKLVYVPYYVTTGAISKEHLLLPAYQNMDYMVAQSEHFKSGCKGMFYYDKILPLGSPKLDRVIRMCEEGVELPAKWESVLHGKKSLMLNTSLNCFLYQGEIYLQKLFHLFEWVKSQDEVVIVWRPHPLLEATIHSMRPQLLEEYQKLVAYFEQENIGIFDRTPDITRTVAAVDGYIGEEATSVVNLFGAAGKPIFILNNTIFEKEDSVRERKIRISDMVQVNGKWYLTSVSYNGLFVVRDDWNQIAFLGRVEEQPKWYGAYLYLADADENVYLSPGPAFDMAKFDTKKGQFEVTLKQGENKQFFRCRQIVCYQQKLFYLPEKNGAILEYCPKDASRMAYTECIGAFQKGIAPEKYQDLPDVLSYTREESKLYIVAQYTNRILAFDMKDGSYRIEEVGENGFGYSAIVRTNDAFWLAEVQSGNLVKWNKKTGEVQIIVMPEGFCCYERANGTMLAHQAIFDMGKWIVTVPAFANGMVKVEKETGKAFLFVEDMWKEAGKPCNEYHPKVHNACYFAKKIDDNRLWVQRSMDDALAEVDVETDTFSLCYPTMSQDSLDRLLEGEDGFERPNRDYYAFARRENRLFSLENFMRDLVSDKGMAARDRQLQELSTFAANLDGTCGEKVHAYMMDVLDKE